MGSVLEWGVVRGRLSGVLFRRSSDFFVWPACLFACLPVYLFCYLSVYLFCYVSVFVFVFV